MNVGGPQNFLALMERPKLQSCFCGGKRVSEKGIALKSGVFWLRLLHWRFADLVDISRQSGIGKKLEFGLVCGRIDPRRAISEQITWPVVGCRILLRFLVVTLLGRRLECLFE